MDATSEEFNTLLFEKRLTSLKDTQDSIQNLSTWCLQRRQHHKKIVTSWLNVLKRAKVEQRLTLFYLANDVIQYSKRKNYEFVESWGTTLQKATPLVRDDKVKHRILRIFKIWEQRTVYDEEFLTDLTGLLSAGAGKRAPDDDPNDFQPSMLVNKVKQCSVLEADTDLRLKHIHECQLSLQDADALCITLKDRRNTDDVQKELEDAIGRMERYTTALQREIVAREALCALLTTANHYYDTQRGEVKVVANAYKNFGARVRGLKRKLDELVDTLPNEPKPEKEPTPEETDSPIITPPRAEDVPSPGPDEDLDLPQNDNEGVGEEYNLEKTFSASILGDSGMFGSGFSSFLGTNNPFNFYQDSQDKTAIVKTIELASAENSHEEDLPTDKTDFNINDFFKSLVPDSAVNNSINENDSSYGMIPPPPPPPPVASQEYTPSPVPAPIISTNNTNIPLLGSVSNDILPGLELLTPTSDVGISTASGPTSNNFYSSHSHRIHTHSIDETEPDLYSIDTNHDWNINSWDSQTILPVPPVSASHHNIETIALDTPESPPLQERHSETIDPIIPFDNTLMNTSIADIDHRLHRSHPPVDLDHRQQILTQVSDVDHRSLLPPPPLPPGLFPLTGDIDQRTDLGPPHMHKSPHHHNHRTSHKDVDHRNLISLTTPSHQTVMHHSQAADQDYRLPPPSVAQPVPVMVPAPSMPILISSPTMVPNPSDIVESVDMDLSEDEDMRSDMHFDIHEISPSYNEPPPTFQYNQPQTLIEEVEELMRPLNRQFSNNNKVLVGGDSPERNKPVIYETNPNLVRINSNPEPELEPEELLRSMHEPLMPVVVNAPFEYKKVIIETKPPATEVSTPVKAVNNVLPPNTFETKLTEEIEAFTNPSVDDFHGAHKLLDEAFDAVMSPAEILRNPSPPALPQLQERFMGGHLRQEWTPVGDSNWHQRMVSPRPPFMNRGGSGGGPRHFGNYNQGYNRFQPPMGRGGNRGGGRGPRRPHRPQRGNYW